MPVSGLGSQLGISATEATYGTPVAVSRFFEFDSESMQRQQAYIESAGLRAGRYAQPSARTKRTTRSATGGFQMDVPTKGLGLLLNLLHSSTVTPTQIASTGAYAQDHPVGSSPVTRSATVQVNKPTVLGDDKAFTYPGSMVSGFQFSCDTSGTLKMSVTLDAQDERTDVALAAAAYTAGVDSWDFTQATVASLNGSPLANVTGFQVGASVPMKADRWFLGSGALKQKPVHNGFTDITGTLNAEWATTSAYDLFASGQIVALVLGFEGAVIGGSEKFTFRLTMPAVQVRGESPTVGGPDILTQSVSFKALDNGTDPQLTVRYVSTDTSL